MSTERETPGFRRLFSATARTKLANAGWLVAERGVGVVIGFFVMTLVARKLGPDNFGVYVYLASLSALVVPLAYFGQGAVLLREAVARPEERAVLLGSSALIMIVFALLGFAGALVAVWLFGGPPGVTVGLMALMGLQILIVPSEVFSTWFKATERMAFVVLPRIAVALLVAGIALYMVIRDYSLTAFVALRGLEQLGFGLVVMIVFAWSVGGLTRFTVGLSEIIRLLRAGLPIMISGIAMVLYMRIDQVMLGQMSTPDELGRYGLAVRISDVAHVVPLALYTSFFASLVRAEARGTLPEQAQRLYDATTLACLVAAGIVAIAAVFLFEPVFGASYAAGVTPTLILLAGLPFFGWSIARQAVLMAQERYWMPPVIAILGAVANIAMNLVAIPRFGGTGAAVATLLTFWLTAFGFSVVLPSLRDEARRMVAASVLTRSFRRLGSGMRI